MNTCERYTNTNTHTNRNAEKLTYEKKKLAISYCPLVKFFCGLYLFVMSYKIWCCQVVVLYSFNPSILEAGAGESP